MPTQLSRVQILVDKYSSSLGLPFQKLLPESFLADAVDEEKIKYRHRIFSPIVTIWAFLSQVLDTDKTCHNAVSRIISWLAAASAEIPSEDNSAYCQARKRLPEKLLQKLFINVGNELESKTTPEDTWCGRHVTTSAFPCAFRRRGVARQSFRWFICLNFELLKLNLFLDK